MNYFHGYNSVTFYVNTIINQTRVGDFSTSTLLESYLELMNSVKVMIVFSEKDIEISEVFIIIVIIYFIVI